MLLRIIRRGLSTTSHRNSSIASWKNKIVINNLNLPSFPNISLGLSKRIYGPTGDEIIKDVDLTGKTCLITGGTSGIGLEIARCLLKTNCDVLMACRNTYAAKIVGNGHCGDNNLLPYEINLASFKSVKNCSENLLEDHSKIDIVILNAAVFGIPWTLTEDGLETIFQVNYLSQFYFLMKLEKILAPDVRVVFMSSESHRQVKWSQRETLVLHEDMLSLPHEKYTSIRAYNISKLCGLLAMRYLGYRWLKSERTVFSAHPGSFVSTNLSSNWLMYETLYRVLKPFTKTTSQAAATPLFCATSPDLNGLSCLYYKDCKETAPSDLAQDSFVSYRLYELSQSIIRDRLKVAETVQETEPVRVKEVEEEQPEEPARKARRQEGKEEEPTRQEPLAL